MSDEMIKVWDGNVVTSDGLKQLKKAARMASAQWYAYHEVGGRAALVCSMREHTPSGRSVETRLEAPCKSFLRQYTRLTETEAKFRSWTGYASIAPKVMSTILSAVLRTGDELELRFGRGAFDSELLTESGLVGDTLELYIVRGKIKLPLCFVLDVQISKDNSARMIKPGD